MSSSSSSSIKVVVGGGGGRKGNNGMNDIPSGSRKIVQSLKEVVNSPEAEIYAMLKDCNMDPNEAVHRLLSQDPFHEVKSKKEKKKETRDIPDSRPRGANNRYNSGGRGGSDRYAGRSASTHLSSADSGNFQGKSTNKKESGTQGYTSSWSSASGVPNHQLTPLSDSVVTENKLPSATGDGISPSQPASGHQTAWFGAPGQMSMADIVKMGRPQNKTTNSKQNFNMRSEINHEHETNANHQVPVKEEWPSIQKPLAPGKTVSVAPAESEVCDGQADFQSARVDQHLSDRLENIHLAESGPSENLGVDQLQPNSVPVKNVQEDDSGVSSEFNENQYAYQAQSHPVEHHKDEDEVSSGSDDLQQLTVDSHDQAASHEEDRRAVVIPNHLLIHTEECSQLSFGSFGAFGSKSVSNNAEETPDVAQQIEHSDARNTEFYGDEHLESTVNGNMGHAAAAGSYDDSLESRQENPETVQEHQYTYAQSQTQAQNQTATKNVRSHSHPKPLETLCCHPLNLSGGFDFTKILAMEESGSSGGGAEAVINLGIRSSVPISYHPCFGPHDDLLLLEADDNLVSDIFSGRVTLRGLPDEDAVLCTKSKTYAIKFVGNSNSMFLIPPSNPPGFIQDDAHGKVSVIKLAPGNMELVEVSPKLDKLKQLLLESPFGPGEADAMMMDDDGSEKNLALYTWSDLVNIIQASDEELLKGLESLSAIEIDGYWRVIDESYLDMILRMLLNNGVLNSWSFDDLDEEEVVSSLVADEFPTQLAGHCLRVFGSEVKGTNKWKLEPRLVCLHFARQVLREEKMRVESFMEEWRKKIPEGMEERFEMLEGEVLTERIGIETRVYTFSVRSLPSTPAERFAVLFKHRPKWEWKDLEPYLRDLQVPRLSMEGLLLKYTRRAQSRPDAEPIFSAR